MFPLAQIAKCKIHISVFTTKEENNKERLIAVRRYRTLPSLPKPV